MTIGFGAELLGWTDGALAELEQLRGWTETAIERLELGWNPGEQRVVIPVRDELGHDHGELRYDPTGRLKPKMRATAGATRQLFPPPELIRDDELDRLRTVFLVEGEPDAIRLWSIGIPAVAVPGAGNWRDEWAERFTGRRWRVIVCFDCDQAGRDAAPRAAAGIVNAGGDARLVDLDPERDDGFDLTDWTRAADTEELRQQAAAALLSIVDATGLYEPRGPDPSSNGDQPAGEQPERPWRSVTWAAFRDQAPPAHKWLVDGLIPAGMLAFVAGPPKKGKTWVGIGLALALALGKPLAGEYPVPAAVDVLYIALEGSQTGLRTRIGSLARGYGADPDLDDLEHLHMLYRPRPFDLAELATSDWLLEEARETDSVLVIVDVLRAAARFQENVAEDFARIRDHLDPLLAEQRTIALLHHFGKLNETQKERSPGERMAGTGAMYGALDVGLLITKSEEGARRLRVDVEARDFAAPEALGLVIEGTGSGKHGGFTYADTARLMIDAAAAAERDLAAEAVAALEPLAEGLSRDDLAAALTVGYKELEAALGDDSRRRRELGEQPRVVRWNPLVGADGRFPGRAHNFAPYLTAEHYAVARSSAQPSQPSLLPEERPIGSVPPRGGDRVTEPTGHPGSGPTEPTEPT